MFAVGSAMRYEITAGPRPAGIWLVSQKVTRGEIGEKHQGAVQIPGLWELQACGKKHWRKE